MSHPFDTLTPDLVLDAVESLGFLSDARVLALNSYENRVYQVGIEGEQPLIAKFYRPGRWSDAAILEERVDAFRHNGHGDWRAVSHHLDCGEQRGIEWLPAGARHRRGILCQCRQAADAKGCECSTRCGALHQATTSEMGRL